MVKVTVKVMEKAMATPAAASHPSELQSWKTEQHLATKKHKKHKQF